MLLYYISFCDMLFLILFFFIFIKSIGGHWVIQLYKFQVYSSLIHIIYILHCARFVFVLVQSCASEIYPHWFMWLWFFYCQCYIVPFQCNCSLLINSALKCVSCIQFFFTLSNNGAETIPVHTSLGENFTRTGNACVFLYQAPPNCSSKESCKFRPHPQCMSAPTLPSKSL